MTPHRPAPATIEAVRAAVASANFPLAARRYEEYIRAASAALRDGTVGAAEVESARQLLEWTRLMARAQRAHLADQLRDLQIRLYVARAYQLPLTPRK
jgi:predicted Zn-dependent peptidase